MKLFYLPGACSLAPHILLNELGLSYELEKLDKNNKTPILKYNPKGVVPTLILDDGQVLTENAAVLQYLADQNPTLNLIPKAGTWERYKCQEWLNYVATELHKGIGVMFNPNFDDNARNVFKKGLEAKFTWLDQIFSKNDFFMGEQFTIPDIYAFVVLRWTKYFGIDLAPYQNISAFMERVRTRPSVQKAIDKEK